MLSLAPDSAGPARLNAIYSYYVVAEQALRDFHSISGANAAQRFIGLTPVEVATQLRTRLDELEWGCIGSTIFALEATFRNDYKKRRRGPKRAPLVREFRALYNARGEKVSFEYELLERWKNSRILSPDLSRDLGDAIKLRHWLAHGRYWAPRLGRQKYDYPLIALLAQRVVQEVPLIT